jgi:hypothetical protein
MRLKAPPRGKKVKAAAAQPPAAAARTTPPAAAPKAVPTGAQAAPPASSALSSAYGQEFVVDLERRREQLVARVAELQWDLGGLVFEMATRNRIDVEVLVKRAVPLQDADAELSEVDRILRIEETGAAGACASCGSPHSSGATYCWQCGQPLLQQISGESILRR